MSAPVQGPAWPPLPAHARVGAPPRAEAEAVEHVLGGALGWLEAHLEWFAPRRWEEFLPPRPFRPGPLLELLGLVRVLDRSGLLPKDAPLPARALDLAERAAHDPDFERGLHRACDLFPYHVDLVALLDVLGRPQPGLRAACEALLAAGAGGHALPYKPVLTRIELRYVLDRGGFTAPAPLPDARALHRQSIAALRPDVLHLTESETYALTHVLFYATDFGRHRHLLGGSGEVARLLETVRVLLGVHLARGSLDLLAELLLCATALDAGRGASGPLVYAGWNALAGAARPDGAVPSPVHRPEVLAGLTGDKAAAYLFGTCYHTTLAAALAAAVRKESGGAAGPRQTPAPPMPSAFPLPAAESGEVRRWARRVSAASATAPASARAAWSAQVDPLLVLCVQARDPAALSDVLHAAAGLDRAARPQARSAAALLAAWTRRT